MFRSRTKSAGVTTAPALAVNKDSSSNSDALGSGRLGKPSIRTARGMTAGRGRSFGDTPAIAAVIAAGARSAHSSSTTASGRRSRINVSTSRTVSSTSTCDTPTRCSVAPPGPFSRRTTRVASEVVSAASATADARRTFRFVTRRPPLWRV